MSKSMLVVPRHRLSCYDRRACCVDGPSVWNSLSDSFRDTVIGGNGFGQSLKTFLFATYWCTSASEATALRRYTNMMMMMIIIIMIHSTY